VYCHERTFSLVAEAAKTSTPPLAAKPPLVLPPEKPKDAISNFTKRKAADELRRTAKYTRARLFVDEVKKLVCSADATTFMRLIQVSQENDAMGQTKRDSYGVTTIVHIFIHWWSVLACVTVSMQATSD
jgi:hypothetical protein